MELEHGLGGVLQKIEMNLREVALLRIAESERPSKKFFS
jgi:hypothetical protein